MTILRISLFFLIFLTNVYHSNSLAVMSIDFGGEFMKIAIVKPGVPMEIVLNKESQRKTASLISIKNGERTFGEPALNAGIRFPKTAYRYLIDLIGKEFNNPVVQRYIKQFSFYDIEKDADNNGILFKNEDGEFYSPEELLAMIFQKAKEYAEAFAEQTITEAVLTVPVYFNQAERRAMLRAGELAGLKILQLLNDNTAVALNYGVFRSKNFNATSQYYMFFDMGSLSSTATIVEYQVVKTKSPTSGITDSYPQLTIRGIGYDRSLGGLEFQLRLRDFLATLFDKTKKTRKDITKDPRAMQKLFKEAGRLKQVLSANADHFAQVEGVFEEEDFRAKVTREEFENLCLDLFDRIEKIVNDSLTSSAISMSEISEVILMGGGTRMPRVQDTLKKIIRREELGKGINTDEAAVLGAVYQAANLGKGFKVKKFNIKDAVLFPIEVEFERMKSTDEKSADVSASSSPKTIHRTLFARTHSYPQKKVLTFNKHVNDFDFRVAYTDMGFLDDKALKEVGSMELAKVSLSGVAETFKKQPLGVTAKGIKAHFRMDESGILYLDRVESLFENTAAIEEELASESTLSKLGKKFTNFFGGGDKDSEPPKDKDDVMEDGQTEDKSETKTEFTEEIEKNPEPFATEESVKDGSDSTDKETLNDSEIFKPNQSDPSKKPDTDKTEETEKPKTKEPEVAANETFTESGKNETKKGKGEEGKNDDGKVAKKKVVKIIKEEIKMAINLQDFVDPQIEKIKLIKKRIEDFQKRDEEKNKLERVKNEIETMIFEVRDKLEQDDYVACSTEEERQKALTVMSAVDDWMLEQTDATETKAFEDQLAKMKGAVRDIFWRVEEMRTRPEAIRILTDRLNTTAYFLTGMHNFTGEDQPFSTADVEGLAKILAEVTDWNQTKTEAQRKTPLTEKPKFTIEDVGAKVALLDREVKYLIGKIKSFRPKTKAPPLIKKVKVKDPKEFNATFVNLTASDSPLDDKIVTEFDDEMDDKLNTTGVDSASIDFDDDESTAAPPLELAGDDGTKREGKKNADEL